MNTRRTSQITGKGFAFLLTTLLLCGCVSEDTEECYGGVNITVRIDPATSNLGAAEAGIRDAVLYVFDNKDRFLERRETVLNQEEIFWYPDAGKLTVVGWANQASGPYTVAGLEPGALRNSLLLRLQTSRAVVASQAPSDLFYGETTLRNQTGSSTTEYKEIQVSRRTGMMTITVRGLQQYTQTDDTDYTVVVGPTHNAIDFQGEHREPEAMHTPRISFNASGELVVPLFNLMPTGGTQLKIAIYHKELGLVYETQTDKDRNPITVVADRTENILIDLRAGISVFVERTLWGVSHIWITHT